MDRATSMLERLPPIYRIDAGSTLEQLVRVIGLQLAMADEDLDRVQRSHWIETAVECTDLARLGALFELAPASFEPDELFRARLVATIAARLRGSVTRAELEFVLRRILEGAQSTLGVRYLAPQAQLATSSGPGADLEFVEFPLVRRRSEELLARRGELRPLDHFVANNRGLDEAWLEADLIGVSNGRTALPVLANLTTGSLVAFAGTLKNGDTLRLRVGSAGALRASVDSKDVSTRVYTSSAFDPSVRFEPLLPDPEPRPLRLARGANDLWFFSIALYDHGGLDHALAAMASPSMNQARFGTRDGESGASFDDGVFFQESACVLDAFWSERQPASFRFDVPAGCVRIDPKRVADPFELDRELFELLQDTLDLLRPAAVRAEVRARPLTETQRASDRCRAVSSYLPPESASAGRDVLEALGALFDRSALDESRLEP